MDYIKFWAAWFSFWATIIGTLGSLYGIVYNEESKRCAVDFVQDSSILSSLRSSLTASSRISSVIFGRKIISLKAFIRGIILSVFVFIIAFFVAVATTPELNGQLRDSIVHWNDNQFPVKIQHWAVYSSFIVAIICLVLEFLYVCKSRFILTFVDYNERMYKVVFLFATDVITTLCLFLIITPALITASSFMFYHAFSSELMHGLVEIEHVWGTPNVLGATSIVIPIEDNAIIPRNGQKDIIYRDHVTPVGVYKYLLEGLYENILGELKDRTYRYMKVSGISNEIYHIEVNGKVVSVPELYKSTSDTVYSAEKVFISNSLTRGGFVEEGNDTNLRMTYGIYYPISTMLSSAFATCIWVALCMAILIILRTLYYMVDGFRRLFFHIHMYPKSILKYGMLPCGIMAVVGGIIIPLFM